jgi:transcriptional regulator of heat shock response
MTSRHVSILARKNEILRVTIEQYIADRAPVSSARVARECSWDLSSATIRNILAELEKDGYLTHPHTSAGRVPTQTGYRYYVDHFINEIQLLEEEKARIKAEYERETLELETLLEKTSKVISDTTHYTSIVSVDGWSNKLFCGGTQFIVGYSEYTDIKQDVHKISNILQALEEKEKLLEVINRDLASRIDVLIGQELQCSNIDGCSLVVSRYQSKQGTSGRIAILGPTRMDYNRVVSALDYFSTLMEEIL